MIRNFQVEDINHFCVAKFIIEQVYLYLIIFRYTYIFAELI